MSSRSFFLHTDRTPSLTAEQYALSLAQRTAKQVEASLARPQEKTASEHT